MRNNDYTLVYRVEHKSYNHGPYCCGRHCYKDKACSELRTLLVVSHSSEITHPSLYVDFYPRHTNEQFNELYEMFCGCETLDKIYQWFYGFRDLLRSAGFVVKVYRVKNSDIRRGLSGKQIFFKKPLCPVKILPIAVDGCF